MDDRTVTSLVGRTVAQYRISQFIGRGGMGQVYLGRDTKLKRDVAIKVLPSTSAANPAARARFVREARLASRVVHPYVATLFDVAESGDELFLIMEHIRGRTLAAVLAERTFQPAEAAALAEEMVEALGAIHRAGLIHRDLKPGNVMLTEDGHVKVMDFGVARAVREISGADESSERDVTLTREGQGAGTVLYMSPEQIRGETVDARSDLFALGDILYETITGVHPFERASVYETASAILEAAPGGTKESATLTASGPLRSVVFRLLEKSPDKRYDDTQALLTDLREIRGGLRPPPTSRIGRVVVAATAVAVIGLAVWLGVSGRLWTPSGSAGAGRPGVLVLPFESATADADGAPRGAMMASLLRADLAGMPALRVVGSTRTDDLVFQARGSTKEAASGKGLVSLAAVRYLISGRYSSEGTKLSLAVDVYDGDAPDKPTAFVVEGATLASLVESLTRELGERLPAARAGPVPRTVLAGLGAYSDTALLAAERGRQAADQGDLLTAQREYETAVADDPDFVLAHLERARVLYEAGFVNRARESVDAAQGVIDKRSLPLPEPLALRMAATRAQVDEKREEEIAARKRVVADAPDNPDTRVELSDALRRGNHHAEALQAVDEALAARPKDAVILLRRARLLRLLGRQEDARAALAAAEKAGPSPPAGRWAASLLMERGDLYRAANQFPEARRSFEEARRLLASAGEPLIFAMAGRSIGEALLREGRPADAVSHLLEAADTLRNAGNLRIESSVLDTTGATLFQLGRYPEAETYLRRAIRQVESTEGLTPRPNPYLNLASVLTYTGRFDEAAAFAAKAESIAAASGDTKRVASAQLQRGVVLASLGRFDDAAAAYETAIRTAGSATADERIGWARSGLSELRLLRGDVTGALTQADLAVDAQVQTKQQLNVAYARVGRARIRRLAGDAAGADADIAQARLDAEPPVDLVARMDLDAGVAALEIADWRTAEAKFRRAAGAPPASDLTGFARGFLAEALCRDGRANDGIVQARKASEPPATFAERLEAGHALAECLRAAGNGEASRAVAEKTRSDALAVGARWWVVQSSLDLIRSGRGGKASSAVTASGRDALNQLIAGSPGGANGAFAARPVVRDAVQLLRP